MASLTQSAKCRDDAGYTCSFVENPPELFLCEICKLVLRNPQITQCCGKNACRSCIAKEAENGEACPISACQKQCVKITPNKDLDYEILISRVYCTSKENDCQWMGTLESLDKHLEECPFLEVECPSSCSVKIQRRLVKDHEAICERFPVKCQKCGDMYERRDRLSHLDACSLTKVKCPFSIVGCTTEVLNKDLQQHFEESLSVHYALVAKQSEDTQAEIRQHKLLTQAKEKVEPLLAQSVEVAGLNDEIVAAEKEEMIELQRALEEAKLEFIKLQQRHDQVAAQLQHHICEREASICAVREEFDNLMLTSKVRCYGPALPCVHPIDIVSRPLHSPETTEEYIPRVSFMIPRFCEERKNDAYICLPPFFSYRGGYKMCLSLYCNSVKGKSASVCVCILSSKYDEKLEWPLQCKVEIEIQSVQKSTSNMKQTIEVKSQSPTPRDTFMSQRPGGCLDALKGLPLSFYLMDGCLSIDVVRVAFNK